MAHCHIAEPAVTLSPAGGGSMRAIVRDRYGSADVLEVREVPVPDAGDGEVLVRVRAAGLDGGVWHIMAGLPT
jgi:threonine dehydrogenase-like Zn-dependent dehydrogenase